MDINWIHSALLLGVGILASIINVVAGGGSYLTLPLLIFTGLSPTVANGSNRVGILVGNLVGSWKFARAGQLRKSDLFYFCLPAALGGMVGAHLATMVDDRFLRVFLAVLMLFGSWTVIKGSDKSDPTGEPESPDPKKSFPLFSGVGVYAGFIQAGTGFFSLAASGALGYNLKRGNAIKTFMNLFLTVPALVVFDQRGLVDWQAGTALAVGMAIGGVLGVRLSQNSKPESLKKMVAAAILVSAVMIIYPLVKP